MDNSEIMWMIALLILLVVLQNLIKKCIFRNQKKSTKKEITTELSKKENNLHKESVIENSEFIRINSLSTSIEPEDRKLVLIKDKNVIARISEVSPAITEKISRTMTNSRLGKREIYEVVIPAGAKLAKSREIDGAYRGFFRGKTINGHANLTRINPKNLSTASNVANGVANVMNIGSLVVGQYYMNEINSKLEKLGEDVNKISEFQNYEFKARILALISGVTRITNFSTEILENEELRGIKLHSLDGYESECEQLLEQVNLTIDKIVKVKANLEFKEYSKAINDIFTQTHYQQTLLTILKEISRLSYLLYKGNATLEYCVSNFNRFNSQALYINSNVSQWSMTQLKLLEIDVQSGRILKKGIERIIAEIPASFDEKWRYKNIATGIKERIESIIAVKSNIEDQEFDVYEHDVKIVIENGQLYYVLDENK